MLKAVRSFFDLREVLEVDCTHLLDFPQIDAHIDVMEVKASSSIKYLHTSPEYEMKKLLAKGSGDIYQIAKVYRKGEVGKRHAPEFTMIEWYRLGFTLDRLMDETIKLIRLFLNLGTPKKITYQEAFEHYLGIDPFTCDLTELTEDLDLNRDAQLDYLFSHKIEPHLDFHIVTGFPPSQAALAKVDQTAKRFEVFVNGFEIANGYDELQNEKEHRRRFHEQNSMRKEAYPLDEAFLSVIGDLPDCCGVSVGFDRLMMLKLKKDSIHKTLPSSFGFIPHEEPLNLVPELST